MTTTLFLIVGAFLGFCGLMDTLVQPRRAFRASGHSKALWALLHTAGMVTGLGLFTILWYSLRVRRGVVAHGGIHRPGSTLAPAAATASSGFELPPAPQSCSACGGTGKKQCSSCGSTGLDPSTRALCHVCGGTGGYPCSSCGGRGHA